MAPETCASAGRPIYGDQVAVFPVDTNDGIIWMTGRDDLAWHRAAGDHIAFEEGKGRTIASCKVC